MFGPRFITITGLDARTDYARVARLSDRYPIEWGVLFSPTRQGQEPRYPEMQEIERIKARSGFMAAAHVCGRYAQGIADGEPDPQLGKVLADRFGRIQINHADPVSPERAVSFLTTTGLFRSASAILQTRHPFRFPDETRAVQWLYDPSGGRGIAPESWPVATVGKPVGYAGGIGPATVAGVIRALRAQTPERAQFWLDMETGVRTDDWLDLDKVEAVCAICFPDR